MSYNLSAIYGKDDNPAERLKPRIDHGVKRHELKKDFDIQEYQSPSMHEMDQPYIDCIDSELLIIDGKVNKDWSIAIAKHFNLTEKDLKV